MLEGRSGGFRRSSAPDVRQSLATLAASGPATEDAAAIHPDAKGNLYIDPKVFPSAVAADLPPQVAESLAHSQMPLSVAARQTDVLCDHNRGRGHPGAPCRSLGSCSEKKHASAPLTN